MGDEITQAPALNVRPLLQPLGEPPGQGDADPGWLAPEPIRTMRQLGRRCGQRAAVHLLHTPNRPGCERQRSRCRGSPGLNPGQTRSGV